ncbi:HIRAN domain-containing protein [Lachnospiraceae bacterium]|nr:HIRAN domain-containing protein [Lachnospiraceae bacterium]
MKDIFFTLTGTNHYYGSDFLKNGMNVKLVKEPDNEYDKEAIRVEIKGLGKIGYVANSPYTVIGESRSAGRLYDLIKKKAKGKIVLVTPKGILCELKPEWK